MRSDRAMGAEHIPTNEIDLAHIGRALSARRWWVIGPTLAGLIGGLIFVNVVTPRYTADARVLLENQETFLTRSERSQRGEISAPDAEAVQSQIQLLTSRDLARRAIKALALQGNEEFDPLAKGLNSAKRALVLLGISRDPTQMSPEDRILEKFAEKLTVLSPTKTRVLTIEFTSENPDLAARAANIIADNYLDMQADAKRDNARVAAQSLATLVADLKSRLNEAEARVEEFRAKSGLLIGANNTVIPTQQLGELNNQVSQARASQADAQAKAKLLREMLRQNRIGDVPDVANNEVIRRIYEQRVSLRGQLALESRTLLPMHPRIKELTAQLADLETQWRAAAERTARTLENDARIAGARVENLTHELESQKQVASAAGAEEVHLRELERAAQVLKEQLDAESVKYQEALARERLKATPADARIIQRALAPQMPSFPKKLPITIFATLAGLILSVGTIISGELLSGRARPIATPRRVEPVPAFAAAAQMDVEAPVVAAPVVLPRAAAAPDDAQVAVLAEAPAGPVTRPVKVEEKPKSNPTPDADAAPSIAEVAAVKVDRARVSTTSVKVVVTPCAAQGKAAESAIALGRNLARRGRTLLVVADRGPAVYERLIQPASSAFKGFADLLADEADFSEVIHRDAASRLQIMPGGVTEKPAVNHTAMIVEALAHSYDFVVFAASPGQALRLAPLIDMAFVIGGEEAEALRDELTRAGADAFLLADGVSADDLVAA